MSPFLYFFYHSVKSLIRFSFKIFYSDIQVVNKKNLQFTEPTILISNHPSTLIDPLQVAIKTKTEMFFLVNASLYKHPIANWFFSTFYCIPIERLKDTNGKPLQNDKAFEKCDDFLREGGTLYIAAQGFSELKRSIGKLKTGSARIAFSAESKNDFNLGLRILPVGLIYSNPRRFRSTVLVNVGEPVIVKDFQQGYQQDPFKAVRNLTHLLTTKLEELTYNNSKEEDHLLRRLEKILQTEKPLSLSLQFQRSKELLLQLQELKHNEPKAYTVLQNETLDYCDKVTTLNFTDKNIAQVNQKNSFAGFLKILLGLPLFIYGWINNFLAFYLPGKLARTLKLYVGYDSTVKLLSGIFFIIPVFYSLQTWLVYHFSQNGWISLVYLLSLIPFGWFALTYQIFAKNTYKTIYLQLKIKQKDKQSIQVVESRKKILQILSSFSKVSVHQ